MKNGYRYWGVATLLLGLVNITSHAASMVRVSCDGTNAGAEVSVNGKSKGTCPLDIQVPPGTVKINASKTFSDGGERLFERVLQVGDGVVTKVAVELENKKTLDMLRAAETGDMTSMLRVALFYQMTKKPERAFHWYLKMAEKGDASAMFSVGDYYKEGEGVPSDMEKAQGWYKRALALTSPCADAGNTSCMVNLAIAHLKGRGVPEDRAKAVSWLKLAKSRGDKSADELLEVIGAQ